MYSDLLKLYVEHNNDLSKEYKIELFKVICKDVLELESEYISSICIAYDYKIIDSYITIYYASLNYLIEIMYPFNKFKEHWYLFDNNNHYQHFCDKLPIKLHDEIMEKIEMLSPK